MGTSLLPPNAEQLVDEALTERTFTNYTETVENVNGKDRTYYHAQPLPQVAADLLAHTDNWPRQIGSTLFAFAPDMSDSNQRYRTFTKPTALFAWIRETLTPRWKNGNGGARDSTGVNYVTAEELYQHLLAKATHYEGISRAPHWPSRRDQFYDYGELPPPSAGHRVFWQLIDYFCLADETYRLLAAAFFLAPSYYRTNAAGDPLPRPAWLVDTVDAQGSGKTSIVDMNAVLYRCEKLEVSMKVLQRDEEKIKRSILSSTGRQNRIALIDNATETIKDETLARWITAKSISGMAPYGHARTHAAVLSGPRGREDLRGGEMNMERSCKTCSFYAGRKDNDGGTCRRHPPVYQSVVRSGFPIVYESCWCGEYQPSTKEKTCKGEA